MTTISHPDRLPPGFTKDRRVWLIVLAGLIYFAWQLSSPDDQRWTVTVEHLLYCGASLAALGVAMLGLRGARHPGTPAALGIMVYLTMVTIGDLVWLYHEGVRGHEMPFPSLADAAYLGSNIPLFMGIMLLPTRPLSLLTRGRVVLDALVSLSAITAFSWYFCFGPMLLDAHATPLARLVGAGYPLMDLLLLAYVFLLTSHSASCRVRRPLRLVQIGLLLVVAGDSYFGVALVQGFYDANDPLSGLWVAGYLFIALGAHDLAALPAEAVCRDLSAAARALPPLHAAMLPYALVVAAGGLLAFVRLTATHPDLAVGVDIAVTVVVVLVVFRQVLSIRENLQLYGKLESAYHQVELLATTDGMTGLLNHRAFRDRLDAAVATALDRSQPLALLMLDVDHFKRFNDTHGHLAGDDILRRLAVVLRDAVRTKDVPARYGGEEFVVILPDTTEAAAVEVAERVRAAVARRSAPPATTISVGVACLDTARATPDRLLDAADRALYEAKRSGRNRVSIASAVDTTPCAA